MEYTEYRELDAAYCAIIDLYEKCKATHNMPFEIEDRFYIELGELAKKRLVARAEMLDSNPKEAEGPERPPYRFSLTNSIVWLLIVVGGIAGLCYGVKAIYNAFRPKAPIDIIQVVPTLPRFDRDVPTYKTDTDGISRPVWPPYSDDMGNGDLGQIGTGTLAPPVEGIEGDTTDKLKYWNGFYRRELLDGDCPVKVGKPWNGAIVLDTANCPHFRIYPFLIDHSKIPDHK